MLVVGCCLFFLMEGIEFEREMIVLFYLVYFIKKQKQVTLIQRHLDKIHNIHRDLNKVIMEMNIHQNIQVSK